MEDIREFVACKYDKSWHACVLHVNDSEIQLTFLHPSDCNKSFMYALPPDFCRFWLQKSILQWIQKLQQVTHMLSVKRNLIARLRN
jgi:hypothetical protein